MQEQNNIQNNNQQNNPQYNNFMFLVPTISLIITNVINHILTNDKLFTLRDFLKILSPNLSMLLTTLLPLLPIFIANIMSYMYIPDFIKNLCSNNEIENNESLKKLLLTKKYKIYPSSVGVYGYYRYDSFLKELKNLDDRCDEYDKLFQLIDLYFCYQTNGLHLKYANINKHNNIEDGTTQFKNTIKPYLEKSYELCNDITLMFDTNIEISKDGNTQHLYLYVFSDFIISVKDLVQLFKIEIRKYENKIFQNYPLEIRTKLTQSTSNTSYLLYKCYNEHIDNIISIVDKYKKFLNHESRYVSCNFCFAGTYGTAKTYTARAIASELNRELVELNLHTLKFEQDLFDFVLKKNDYTKCVYLIDEIDMICPDRNNDVEIEKYKREMITKSIFTELNKNNIEEDEETKKDNKNYDKLNDIQTVDTPITLRSLLRLVSGGTTPQELVIIATTNFPEKLDPALIRAGRLKLLEFKNLRKIDAVNMLLEMCSKEEALNILENYQDYKISGALMSYFMSCSNTVDEIKKLINEELNKN